MQLSFWKVEESPPVEYRPKVRDLPVKERPVNRLRHAGPGALSTTEIVACLLQTPDALDQAQQLLARFEGLSGLARACETEMTEVMGIGPAQAARIKAAMEFGRRLMAATPEDRIVVRSPADVAQLLMAEMSHHEQEHFKVLYLDTRNRLLGGEDLYVGSLNASHIRAVAAYLRQGGRRAPEKDPMLRIRETRQGSPPSGGPAPLTCPICGAPVETQGIGFWRCPKDTTHYWQWRGEQTGIKSFLTQSHPAKSSAFHSMTQEEREAFLDQAIRRMHRGGYTPYG